MQPASETELPPLMPQRLRIAECLEYQPQFPLACASLSICPLPGDHLEAALINIPEPRFRASMMPQV
jgi:hypothetical protein